MVLEGVQHLLKPIFKRLAIHWVMVDALITVNVWSNHWLRIVNKSKFHRPFVANNEALPVGTFKTTGFSTFCQ